MARTKHSTRRSHAHALSIGLVTGNAPPAKPYVRGATGSTRPAPADTYTLDGTTHRWDGKCHEDCENLR